jgi:phage-related protein
VVIDPASKQYEAVRAELDGMAMPSEVVDVFGFALHLAQHGGKHPQAKPLKGFGSAGVLEDDDGSTYRAVYTVRFGNAVYVLHCFQKKSHKGIETPIELYINEGISGSGAVVKNRHFVIPAKAGNPACRISSA